MLSRIEVISDDCLSLRPGQIEKDCLWGVIDQDLVVLLGPEADVLLVSGLFVWLYVRLHKL